MRSPLLRISAVTLLCMTLAGCQTPTSSSTSMTPVATPVSATEQLNQVASLVAASRYLKSQCNRSDIPDDAALLRSALNVAQQRSWHSLNLTTLTQRSDQLYQGLLQDGTPKEVQCSEFNRSLAPFIAQLRK